MSKMLNNLQKQIDVLTKLHEECRLAYAKEASKPLKYQNRERIKMLDAEEEHLYFRIAELNETYSSELEHIRTITENDTVDAPDYDDEFTTLMEL